MSEESLNPNIIPHLIIVEGPDNVGKDYIINLLNKILNDHYNKTSNWFNSIYNIHCLKPSYGKLSDRSVRIDFTTRMYKSIMAKQCINMLSSTDAIIMNRSYLSEFVYGFLYRGMTDTERINQLNSINGHIFDCIINSSYNMPSYFYKKTDEQLEKAIYDNILYLQLDAPVYWLVEHDDGKSQSENDSYKIEQERSEFDVLFNTDLPFRKVKLLTFDSINNDWKTETQLIKELKDILYIEQ